MTPTVRKMYGLLREGHQEKAQEFLPIERAYPVSDVIAKKLGINVNAS